MCTHVDHVIVYNESQDVILDVQRRRAKEKKREDVRERVQVEGAGCVKGSHSFDYMNRKEQVFVLVPAFFIAGRTTTVFTQV